MAFLSLAGIELPSGIEILTAGGLLTINSALNPLLYSPHIEAIIEGIVRKVHRADKSSKKANIELRVYRNPQQGKKYAEITEPSNVDAFDHVIKHVGHQGLELNLRQDQVGTLFYSHKSISALYHAVKLSSQKMGIAPTSKTTT
ncbi:unnamed protein product [Clavelina lepadiformis]|uniref:Uncharacterized protein n=1 Tax=Clavelina lepadiformis TaxID=159417 RepID=A0ABP0FZ34_CLALP